MYMVMWDWDDQPSSADIELAIQHGGHHCAFADTGSDMYALVFASRPIDEEAATIFFRNTPCSGMPEGECWLCQESLEGKARAEIVTKKGNHAIIHANCYVEGEHALA
jgi:hypothetical protein